MAAIHVSLFDTSLLLKFLSYSSGCLEDVSPDVLVHAVFSTDFSFSKLRGDFYILSRMVIPWKLYYKLLGINKAFPLKIQTHCVSLSATKLEPRSYRQFSYHKADIGSSKACLLCASCGGRNALWSYRSGSTCK